MVGVNVDPSTLADAALLTKLKNVDGTGSGLDSDLVRGVTPSTVGLAGLAAVSAVNVTGLSAEYVDGVDASLIVAQKLLSSGLQCRLSFDGIPEIPDGTTPTYLSSFATADGWATMGADTVVTQASSEMVLTAGASPTTFVRANKVVVVSSKTIRIKWRCAQADLTTLEVGTSGAGTHVTKSIAGLTSGIVDITTGANFTDFELLFNSTGNNANPVYVVFVYVGDGTYATKAPDVSGSGNSGTIYGATPVDGLVGKALGFDGVNDYLSFNIGSLGTAFSFALWVRQNDQAVDTFLFARGGTYPRLRSIAANQLYFQYLDSGSTVRTAAYVTSRNPNEWYHIACVHTGSVASIYVNGALGGSYTSDALSLSASYIVLGSLSGSTYMLGGQIGDPRIYNRALSAAEIWELYRRPIPSGGPVNGIQLANMLGGQTMAKSLAFASGMGIDFGATTDAAGKTGEILADYEEGTWTPGITFGGSATGVTYTTQAGSYTKIGNRVYFTGWLKINAHGSLSGSALVTGLPFTVANAEANRGAFALRLSGVTFANSPIAAAGINTTTVLLKEITNAGVVTDLAETDFADASEVYVSGHYYV